MLEWTGERFLPWIREATVAYEHLHRYAFAATLVKDKRVLDLACGEGYGCNMLASAASSVIGIDIDETVIRHASAKYGAMNLDFRCGSIAAVPIQENESFDFIVCFEAIEHIEDHASLLAEVQRLLAPGGAFVVSTPNKTVYHDEPRSENPFHVRELYFEEFRDLLAGRFRDVQFFGQRIHPASSIWPIGNARAGEFREYVLQRADADFEFVDADCRVPLYFIAIASNAPAAPAGAAGVLLDESDSLFKEKDEVIRWNQEQVVEREKTIGSLESALAWREQQIQELTKGLEWTKVQAGAMEKAIASHEQALAWRAQQVNDLQTANNFWESQHTALAIQMQNTQRQLAAASDSLAGIYASRGWKLILQLRRLRNAVMSLVKFRG
jgi:SAM-dependent methyltransferase